MTEGQRANEPRGQEGYKQLHAWQVADDLAVSVYESTRDLYRADRWLASQIRRAAISVPANIAEGYSRQSIKDYLRFLSIARGSLAEVEYFIHFLSRVSLLDLQTTEELDDRRKQAGGLLFLLIHSLRAKATEPGDSARLREVPVEYEPASGELTSRIDPLNQLPIDPLQNP